MKPVLWKKTVSATIALSLLAGLTACSNSTKPENIEKPEADTTISAEATDSSATEESTAAANTESTEPTFPQLSADEEAQMGAHTVVLPEQVESSVRSELNKKEGELTQLDLYQVTDLYLSSALDQTLDCSFLMDMPNLTSLNLGAYASLNVPEGLELPGIKELEC